MFSVAEKQKIASEIEKLLLSFGHPEMPTEKQNFTLCVAGKEQWSWAEISPNWQYDENNPPAVNPWNEKQSTLRKPKVGQKSTCESCGKEIQYTGKYWEHTTYSPRHPAVPPPPKPPGARDHKGGGLLNVR